MDHDAGPEPVANIFQPSGRLRLDLFDDQAALALAESLRLTRETRWDNLRSPHVFMGLLAAPDAGVRDWGRRIGEDLSRLLELFQELFNQEGAEIPTLELHREFLSDNVLKLLRQAYRRAVEHGRQQTAPMDLLICLLTAPQSVIGECFERIGVTAARLTELAVIAERHSGDGG